jgi:hypothetical protein
MFSSWAKSWLRSWGGSWGYSEKTSEGGIGGQGRKKKRLVVVEYDGKEYRVPEDQLQAFLQAIETKAEDKPAVKTIKKRKVRKVVEVAPPEVIIKSAPPDIIESVQTQVDYANIKIANILHDAAIRYFQQMDEEDELILLMMG